MSKPYESQPLPPWIEYPKSDPIWGGWRQGVSEAWLQDVWLPFWRGITKEARTEYLNQNPPPTDEWRIYLEEYW